MVARCRNVRLRVGSGILIAHAWGLRLVVKWGEARGSRGSGFGSRLDARGFRIQDLRSKVEGPRIEGFGYKAGSS